MVGFKRQSGSGGDGSGPGARDSQTLCRATRFARQRPVFSVSLVDCAAALVRAAETVPAAAVPAVAVRVDAAVHADGARSAFGTPGRNACICSPHFGFLARFCPFLMALRRRNLIPSSPERSHCVITGKCNYRATAFDFS